MQLAPHPTQTLADFTSANLILPKLYERTTTGVINELNQRLQMHEGVSEHLLATTAAINHEVLASMHECRHDHRPGALDDVAAYALCAGARQRAIALAGIPIEPYQFRGPSRRTIRQSGRV